jgi:pimeloyl-ACP methyl ester carboxylesterase
MTVTTSPISLEIAEKLTWNWRGHQIKYAVSGEGRPLLLIHGFGASIDHWRKNIPVLAAGGYRIYAIDLLGFGGSDKAPIDYSMELWEELVVDFWHEYINQPTVFVGNSIGALLSLMLVAHHPEISAGAVLINCAGGLNHRPDELNFLLRNVMAIFTNIVASPAFGNLLFDRVRQKANIRKSLYQVYPRREAVTDELIDIIYQPACDRGAQQVFASILTAPPGPTPTSLLPQIQQPLLVLWGDKDPWTPIKGAKVYQELASAGRDIQVVSIPNAGHCPHDEYPELVNPAILEWLARSTAIASHDRS